MKCKNCRNARVKVKMRELLYRVEGNVLRVMNFGDKQAGKLWSWEKWSPVWCSKGRWIGQDNEVTDYKSLFTFMLSARANYEIECEFFDDMGDDK